ncbi:MAG: hypothetical protein FWH53_03640 [Leptospirales bacterium]|nr:hypothetical protein [Leptospirales bacterium]
MKSLREYFSIYRYIIRLIPLFFVLTLVFPACSILDELLNDDESSERQFWAIDSEDNLYQLEAHVAAESDYCKIWVEKGIGLDPKTIQKVINEYEKNIRPTMLKNFSIEGTIIDPETNQNVGDNILDYADYLTDGDRKLSILILDIPSEDEFTYVAGYFWSNNFYEKSYSKYSNECDLIYLNSILLEKDPSESYTTLAHELQHLMNFSTTLYTRFTYDGGGNITDFNEMDLWIDEGLSAAAEWVYSGQHSQERLDQFNDMPGETYKSSGMPKSIIHYGNNFFVWGEEPDYILDEYATVYIFFQWLRLQTKPNGSKIEDGAEIYKEIIASKEYNHEAVVNAVKGKGNYAGDANLQWETLLRDWLVANALVESDLTKNINKKYSYMDDPDLSDLMVYTVPVSGGLDLYPGEGIYSGTSSAGLTSSYTSGSGPNIKYVGANLDTKNVSNTNTYADGILITYNTSTLRFDYEDENSDDLLEWGKVASINYYGSPISSINVKNNVKKNTSPIIAQAQTKSKTTDKLFKPQAISMGDMLRKNGHKDFGLKKSGLKKPIFKKARKDK